jgi:putative intracellular protease/amidase
MNRMKILIIATSREQMGDSIRKTGLWLEELAVPYYIFKDAGAQITLASPNGGSIPLDPKSESIIVSSSTTKKFQKDPEAIALMSNSLLLSEQKADNFDFVFLPGGHGSMWDFTKNEPLKILLENFNRQNKPIGLVSHGVAGLLQLENSLGEPLMKDRKLTAFSNHEEQIRGLTDTVPFLLESAFIALGAVYSKGPDFLSHTVIDGNIITGQNSSSAREVARNLLLSMKISTKKAEAALN